MAGEGPQVNKTTPVGHRGWLIRNVPSEDIVRCQPSPYSKAKLAAYPQPLIWPRLGDLKGGMALVEAVMTKDLPALEAMQAQWPEVDLGLGDWYQQLRKDFVAASAKSRTVLKERWLPNGRRLALELVTDGDTGSRQLVASFYRGRTRLTEKVLKSDQKASAHV